MWFGEDIKLKSVRITIDLWKLPSRFTNGKAIEFGCVRWGNISVVEKESIACRAKYRVWWIVCWMIQINTSEAQALSSWKCLKDIFSYAPVLLSVWISIFPLLFLYIILVLGTQDLHRCKWHHLATDLPSVTQHQVTHLIPWKFWRETHHTQSMKISHPPNITTTSGVFRASFIPKNSLGLWALQNPARNQGVLLKPSNTQNKRFVF